jgi:two-component system, OmpR family, sensor kinase
VGRLFWKFFAFIWLAQLAGIVATASSFWVMQFRAERVQNEIDAGPGAIGRVESAAMILRYGGAGPFREWAANHPGPGVFAVDESGHDLLNRPVSQELVALARQSVREQRGPPTIIEENGADGHRYLFFSAGGGAFAGMGYREPPRPRPGGWRGYPPLIPSVATLLASLATAFGLAWYVAKPVRSLRTAFDAVAGGNLDVRVAPSIGGRQDELADLGRDFDRMAARLQASMNGQRRLLHDVSHEMRSPLARLQAATGLIRLKIGAQEPAIERIEEEIVRIDRLVGDLLKLSRLEAGELTGPVEDVDMRELVREVLDDANFEAQATGREVIWDEETRGTVVGRPEMLHGAIENVVRNALKHAPQTPVIRLQSSVDAEAGRYTLQVVDAGPGVAEAELAGLFTPFFRAADSARTDGYGLGLAIARRSIEAHGGTIVARNRPEGGLEVTLSLPLKVPLKGSPA